jgi:succinate-acetate transporter protein
VFPSFIIIVNSKFTDNNNQATESLKNNQATASLKNNQVRVMALYLIFYKIYITAIELSCLSRFIPLYYIFKMLLVGYLVYFDGFKTQVLPVLDPWIFMIASKFTCDQVFSKQE